MVVVAANNNSASFKFKQKITDKTADGWYKRCLKNDAIKIF